MKSTSCLMSWKFIEKEPILVSFASTFNQETSDLKEHDFKMKFLVIVSPIFFFPLFVEARLSTNYEYVPNYIPNNYLVMLQGKPETILRKIDSETSKCGPYFLELREITILKLQAAFKAQKLTSAQLVQCYLKRIALMNPLLNAVLQTNPLAVEIAKELDEKRNQGDCLGPLHGIPIMLKDTMGTADGMESTAGSVALLGLKPKSDAEVVERLREAGAIILGKANLSEFGNFRATDMPNGWSGRGGRTKNVFVRSADSSGSSSGSAVSVSANMVTAALGGETDGSIVSPSAEASLVGLKPTLGRVPTSGCIGISTTQDVIGPICRTVPDAAIVFNAIANGGFRSTCFSADVGLDDCLTKQPFRIGVLRSPFWERDNVTEELQQLERLLAKLRVTGFVVVDPVVAAPGANESITGDSEYTVLLHEFKHGLNEYLRTSVIRPASNKINTLADVIAFNTKFPPKEGYNQVVLQDAQATDGLENTTYIANRNKNKLAAQNYVHYLLTKYQLDAIVYPTTEESAFIPAVAGYPHITVPAGFKSNGLSFGFSFFADRNSDEKLLMMAYKMEKVFPARRTSSFLD